MKAQLRCKACGETWQLVEEPSLLDGLRCPGCSVQADGRASEDLASAVDDAMLQLWRVGQAFEVKIAVDSEELPDAFRPPIEPSQ